MIVQEQIGKCLGVGRVAEVFEFGARVIKLYRPGEGKADAFREAETLCSLETTGLPVPGIFEVGQYEGRWGVVMSRAPEGFATIPPDPQTIAILHSQIHEVSATRLHSLKARLADRIARARQLSSGERDGLLIELAQLPEGNLLCHGDFHPGNIMGSLETPFFIDWVDASKGPPEADACRTYLLARTNAPGLAEPYLEAYVHQTKRSRQAILEWLPIVAAVRLTEKISHEENQLLELAKTPVAQHLDR